MKKVYISFLLHGNMCYDRYPKQLIRAKFPLIYATGIRAMHRFPQVTAHIDFPGLTVLSLKHHAPWLLDEMRPLIARRQIMMLGCQYAASHALCADEESDLLAARLTMQIMRDELEPDAAAFFPQESPFHPQQPYMMHEIGVSRLALIPTDMWLWMRPRRVRGVDGQELNVYATDSTGCRPEKLEAFYDEHEDGDFVMTGGDFEMLGRVEEFVDKMAELAERGKVIEWMTMERYEREIGIQGVSAAPTPHAHAAQDSLSSPSFSRWTSDPQDIVWHGRAVEALDAIRTAGWAKLVAARHDLGAVDAPISRDWTSEPDNALDHYYEHALEYPEAERYLALGGAPTLLSRAWHHLLIGLNSDASGWVPWAPRTRHREIVLQTSHALSNELLRRFADRLANKLSRPATQATSYRLALNPAPARTVELTTATPGPMSFAGPDGRTIPTAARLQDGQWSATARVQLPAYGYKLLALTPAAQIETCRWTDGHEAHFASKRAVLVDGVLTVGAGDRQAQVSIAPYKMSDPAGIAESEQVIPHWRQAATRVRQTMLGGELEVTTELAWTVWLRLVIALREDRIELTAQLDVDLPRRIGQVRFDPEGLRLAFKGQPGAVYYDIPYATIQHANPAASFVAAQRFAAIEGVSSSFGVIALGGNQSFEATGQEGVIAAGLGASKAARPGRRPECNLLPDGTAQHVVVPDPDAMFGASEHRFALVFADRAETALEARRLRIGAPVLEVEPKGGDWPGEGSLLPVQPETAYVTAFRVTEQGSEVVVNDLSGQPGKASCAGASVALGPYSVATLRL